MAYPGGKGASGVVHRIINLMPPHPVFCSPFLGQCAVMRLKRPAAYNIGVDLDADVIRAWRSRIGENACPGPGDPGSAGVTADSAGGIGGNGYARSTNDLVVSVDSPISADAGEFTDGSRNGKAAAARRRRSVISPLEASGGIPADCGSADAGPRFRFLRGDGLTFLASYPFQPTDLIYCDPPYLMETRSGRRLYRHEFSDEQHAELLSTIGELPCRVMISGYWSEMYACRLKRWNCIHFDAMTRGGMATEWLWYNFPDPVELHDYRFLGETRRQRQDLKRMVKSWTGKLERMPALKKQALLAAIAGNGGNADGIR